MFTEATVGHFILELFVFLYYRVGRAHCVSHTMTRTQQGANTDH